MEYINLRYFRVETRRLAKSMLIDEIKMEQGIRLYPKFIQPARLTYLKFLLRQQLVNSNVKRGA